ncbi:MAG: class I SAM-dependent methyltransferase, partial [Lachnospiraceae bacterium]|nr:class I SAM-dependent methyltransferase [Lachnospiraceae bacterium]
MWIADQWKEYQIIDTSNGEKVEQWGPYRLIRPDPQVIWDSHKKHEAWTKPNAQYHRSEKGGGEWEFFDLPDEWSITYGKLTFRLKPFRFKHTGIFPEQAVNWDWAAQRIREASRKRSEPIKVLNLFAYTGGATVAAAKAGARVCHVDAAKAMIECAKKNAVLSKIDPTLTRY